MADYRPQTAAYDKEIVLWTYQDVVEHLLDFFRIGRSSNRDFRTARRAVDTAYRDMPYKHRWQYYDRQFGMLTEASQSTGTVAYDYTGGAYERELTLSGATWPTNIKHYKIAINDRSYRVEDKKSTTIITLEQSNNPGADIAAGATYSAYRESYPLPIDFRKIGRFFDEDNEHDHYRRCPDGEEYLLLRLARCPLEGSTQEHWRVLRLDGDRVYSSALSSQILQRPV